MKFIQVNQIQLSKLSSAQIIENHSYLALFGTWYDYVMDLKDFLKCEISI